MINPFKEINWHPERSDILSFGRSMLIGFTAIALFFLAVNLFKSPLSQVATFPVSLFFAGVCLYLISNIGTPIAKLFYFVWYGAAATIGIVVANLLLALFYYLFFSIFAVLFRNATGRDPLALKKNPNRKSWWIATEEDRELKRYFKQY